MARLRVTILGCGSSGGVPRLGGLWGACDPEEPRNRRRRCSILVERVAEDGAATRVLIDTSPDMRDQLLGAGVGLLDAVVYTHPHADHVHGIDDLRMVVFNRQRRLPVWADAATSESLLSRFAYAFVQPPESLYPPILDLHRIEGAFAIEGPGGPLRFQPLEVEHGRIRALGFRVNDFAYVPDVSEIPEETWPALARLDTLVLDALRYAPHPTHAHLERSLEWIARLSPRSAVLTNMHIDLDYATLRDELPPGVVPAHDGMILDMTLGHAA